MQLIIHRLILQGETYKQRLGRDPKQHIQLTIISDCVLAWAPSKSTYSMCYVVLAFSS